MTESIKKVRERHTQVQIDKRDGETAIAVGLFVCALGLPVLIGTLWALDNFRGAIVNAVCGLVLLLIGGSAIAYGLSMYRKATKFEGG